MTARARVRTAPASAPGPGEDGQLRGPGDRGAEEVALQHRHKLVASGFAQYLRPFSVRRGWLSAPVRVSRTSGAPAVWPGDTIGISVLPRGHGRPRVMVSWGSAVSHQISQIWAASVTSF